MITTLTQLNKTPLATPSPKTTRTVALPLCIPLLCVLTLWALSNVYTYVYTLYQSCMQLSWIQVIVYVMMFVTEIGFQLLHPFVLLYFMLTAVLWVKNFGFRKILLTVLCWCMLVYFLKDYFLIEGDTLDMDLFSRVTHPDFRIFAMAFIYESTQCYYLLFLESLCLEGNALLFMVAVFGLPMFVMATSFHEVCWIKHGATICLSWCMMHITFTAEHHAHNLHSLASYSVIICCFIIVVAIITPHMQSKKTTMPLPWFGEVHVLVGVIPAVLLAGLSLFGMPRSELDFVRMYSMTSMMFNLFSAPLTEGAQVSAHNMMEVRHHALTVGLGVMAVLLMLKLCLHCLFSNQDARSSRETAQKMGRVKNISSALRANEANREQEKKSQALTCKLCKFMCLLGILFVTTMNIAGHVHVLDKDSTVINPNLFWIDLLIHLVPDWSKPFALGLLGLPFMITVYLLTVCYIYYEVGKSVRGMMGPFASIQRFIAITYQQDAAALE